MKHFILGTAGHVDHGKTSLVKALTGIDCDRLKEEKARGITIELGFAHLELPGDIRFGIVDVPGHERFVRAMVAGAGGMDLVMLVIAADEGVMPQTREHLEICQLLGVKNGLVALTRSDLVDPEWLGLATEEVGEYLAGSFLDGAAIIPVSSRTGSGLDALRDELARLAGSVQPKRNDGPFRLPVDRIFTVAGFGTVVTGTLLSGRIRMGDDVELLPGGLTGRVRGIQVHGEKSETGDAGQRLAINLQGVDHSRLQRGDVVVPQGVYRPTQGIDVRLEYLGSAPRELKHRSTLRLHSGTSEVSAQVYLFDRGALAPGETAYAHLRLARPVLLLPGDPFVLRTYSPQATLGGGRVLDPFPPKRRRRSAEALELLVAVESGGDTALIGRMIANSFLSGLSWPELTSRTGLSVKRLDGALSQLCASGAVIQVLREPRCFLGQESFCALREQLLAAVHEFMKANPLKEGMGREELKGRLPGRSDPRFFPALLSSLEKDGTLSAERDLVKLPRMITGTESVAGDLHARIGQALQDGGVEPPTLKELCDRFGIGEKLLLEHLNLLAREGGAVKVKGDIFYPPAPVAAIREQLITFLREHGEITPAQFREFTGLSRKFMIPLLEFFDGEKTTIRVGDSRKLRRV